MEILVVEGKSDVGKSTVIKEVVKDLIANEQFHVKWMNYSCKGQDPISVIDDRWYTKRKKNVSDIRILLEKDGKCLCIVSVGDMVKAVIDAYKRTVRHLTEDICVLFVCACHPNSPARRMLDAWAAPSVVKEIKKSNIQHDVRDELKDKILQILSSL